MDLARTGFATVAVEESFRSSSTADSGSGSAMSALAAVCAALAEDAGQRRVFAAVTRSVARSDRHASLHSRKRLKFTLRM